MGIDFTTQFFRNAAIMEENLEEVEEQLQEVNLPEDVLADISEVLESLDKRVGDLSNKGFKKRILSAKKTLVNREISVILSSAKDLENSLINNDLARIATKVNDLKNTLKAFQNRHGQGYDFIKEGSAFIACVEKLLAHPKKSKGKRTEDLEIAYQALSQALAAQFEGKKPTKSEAVLIEDLFELARCVYHHQQGVEGKLEALKSQLGSKNLMNRIQKSQGNGTQLSAALLEVGHELAGKPFDGDVKGWFKEVDSLHEIPSFVYQNV